MKREYLVFMGLGFELTALIIAGVLGGRWLDSEYQLKGLGVAAGCLGALLLWIIHLFRAVKALEKAEKAENKGLDTDK